jgi:hypothetical protein
MDENAPKGSRSSVVDLEYLEVHGDNIIIGVVKSCTLQFITIITGSDESIELEMERICGGFIVGKIVIYNKKDKSVTCVENSDYRFLVK